MVSFFSSWVTFAEHRLFRLLLSFISHDMPDVKVENFKCYFYTLYVKYYKVLPKYLILYYDKKQSWKTNHRKYKKIPNWKKHFSQGVFSKIWILKIGEKWVRRYNTTDLQIWFPTKMIVQPFGITSPSRKRWSLGTHDNRLLRKVFLWSFYSHFLYARAHRSREGSWK